MSKMLLREIGFQRPQLLESYDLKNSKSKRFKLKLIECDVQGQNKRIYPLKNMELQIESVQERVKNRQLVGELDHPSGGDDRSSLVYFKEQSHLITKLNVDKNNKIVDGEFEIIESNPNGKILMNLLEQNISIGSSLRQSGELKQGGGNYIVESLDIITWDIVSNPSYNITYFNKENIIENVQYIVNKNVKNADMQILKESKYKEKLTDIILFKLLESDITKDRLIIDSDVKQLRNIITLQLNSFTNNRNMG